MTAGRWRDSYRAELLRLRRWPALWVLAGVYPLLQTTFGFVLPYIAYRGGDAGPPAEGELPPAALLASMAPDAVPGIVTQGTPLFGGALLLILAALAVGGGYGWGTWKTVTTLGPGRTAVLGGTVAALGTVVVALVAVCVLLAIGCSGLVTAVSGAPLGLPPLGDLARAAGGAALVLGM